MADLSRDQQYMARALELAVLGQGHVEPNPMVGCVIVAGEQIVGEGWHRRYGGPHAEREALAQAGAAAAGATMYVTLEPCCHHGKTPPCTDAILQAGIRRVVVAHRDPFPQVDGGGIGLLQAAGLDVEVGADGGESRWLNAPYLKLVSDGRPWVIAKWAMTLDGKLAARSGDSRWISGESSRRRVHQLRGRVDAIMVGAGTVRADDPSLTARPPAPGRPCASSWIPEPPCPSVRNWFAPPAKSPCWSLPGRKPRKRTAENCKTQAAKSGSANPTIQASGYWNCWTNWDVGG
jgi:diaminohydroxyphosphoribosylaminopyrimidine deaminase / 5-amino-6-(5-phosphoribosylamino)uracil reductase